MRFRVVTKNRLYEVEADSCEIYEGKFIRLYNDIAVSETKALPRMFGRARAFETKSVKKQGIALFPIEQVVLVTPLNVDESASAIEARSDETQSGSAEGESAVPNGETPQ